jgi:HD-GYP domain-containing protein (c-di-GMP phosphodiesterase class II)
MSSLNQNSIPHLYASNATLNERLNILHDRILTTIPSVDRIAVAIYDELADQLKTFINSTRKGEAITLYDFKLSESPALYDLAVRGTARVIDEIQEIIKSDTQHSEWLKKQGFRSSFTLPIYDNGALMGFIFFDSMTPAAFTLEIQRDLTLYANLINISISNEFTVVRSFITSVKVARDFANLRDFETGAHLERMARYSRIIAKSVAPMYKLSDEFVEHVFLFAPLHDIGKIGISDNILLKPGRLTPEERIIMETHVEKGYEIVEKILGDFALRHLPDSKIMINIVKSHHEFLDGTGYPRGLKNQDIPIEARIVTVADIYDALTSKRPYKAVWSAPNAHNELNKMVWSGKLDSVCVKAIIDHFDEAESIRMQFQDTTF